MPGFTLNVQGLEVLFNILRGLLAIANPIRSRSIENALPILVRETRHLGWVMNVIGIGDNCLPLPIVHLTPLFLRAQRWASLDPGSRAERRCGHS
jgi:hypothetical protein